MTTATETLTIRLPAAAAYRLRRIAEIVNRPVDEIIAETLRAGLPPLLEDVPVAFRGDLALLEPMSNAELQQYLRAKLDSAQLAHYDALLAANSAGTLDKAGQKELATLRAEADRLMFRKAYAALLLKWRGERIPSLAELETEK
jgi:hypothetical protein